MSVVESQVEINSWVERISNAIIFNEKLSIVLNDNPIPCEYHPYYLLIHNDGKKFMVKGFRQDPVLMLNFELSRLRKCECLDEQFIADIFPERDVSREEFTKGYSIYTSIDI